MADKKKEAAAPAPAEGEEGGKKKSNMVLVIGIIAGIVAVQTALVYLIVPKPVDEAAVAAKAVEDSLRREAEAATRMGAVTETPIEVIVNIAGTEAERFLKASIILEYDGANVKFGEELGRRAPRFRDLMMNHLSRLTLMEVTEPGAKDKIRKDLLRMINETLPAKMGEVDDVLFTSYIIQ